MVKRYCILVLITLSIFLLCGVCSADFQKNSAEKSIAYHVINDALLANSFEGIELPEQIKIMIFQALAENDEEIVNLLKEYTLDPEEQATKVCCRYLHLGTYYYKKMYRRECNKYGEEVAMSKCEQGYLHSKGIGLARLGTATR